MKAIIIHGCPSDKEKAMDHLERTYDKHWIPWTKGVLEGKGISTKTPLMPDPWEPDYAAWKAVMDSLDVNEETVLIGHSCGCAFLVHWLQDTGRKVRQLILVAPWRRKKEDESVGWLHDFDIDANTADQVGNIVMFTADDEAPDGKEGLREFHEALGGQVIELKGRGHYTFGDMGTEEFPELIQAITEKRR